MKKIILIILIFPFIVKSQSKVLFGGTYIAGIICKESIVLGADSRSVAMILTSLKDEGHVGGYQDQEIKIFFYKNIAFGIAGVYTFPDDDLTMRGLLSDFSRKHHNKIKVGDFANELITFAKSKLSTNDFSLFNSNAFLIAGYENGNPNIYFFNKGIEMQHLSGLGFITSRQEDNAYMPQIFEKHKNYINNMQSIKYMERFIDYEIDQKSKFNVSHIGGQSCIVSLSKNGVNLNSTPFIDDESTLKSHYEKILSGKIKMRYSSKIDSTTLTMLYKSYIDKH